MRCLLVTWVAFGAVAVMRVAFGGQATAGPPLPFEDTGACPFEGCVYRQWRAREAVDIHVDRSDDSPVLFKVAQGETFSAVTGVVVTRRPGRAQFDRPQRLSARPRPIEVLPGQDLLLLTYQGEGFTKAWFGGQLYTDVDISGAYNAACEVHPARCTGHIVDKPESEWWVQVRSASGQIGWTRETGKFDGKDRSG